MPRCVLHSACHDECHLHVKENVRVLSPFFICEFLKHEVASFKSTLHMKYDKPAIFPATAINEGITF